MAVAVGVGEDAALGAGISGGVDASVRTGKVVVGRGVGSARLRAKVNSAKAMSMYAKNGICEPSPYHSIFLPTPVESIAGGLWSLACKGVTNRAASSRNSPTSVCALSFPLEGSRCRPVR